MVDGIVITGAGIVSAIGVGKDETLRSLIARKSGLPGGKVGLSDLQIKTILGIKEEETVARTSLLGILAVKEALEQAGIADTGKAALISGTTVGGMDISEDHYLEMLEGGRPDYFRHHTCGSSTDRIAGYFGGFGAVTTTSTACSSVANSIIFGANLIRSGRFDVVVAGGSECLTRYHTNGFDSLMILDKEPCRPFDASRAGLNLGEGAGFVVLESEAHALARGIQVLGRLEGWGNACDAFHQTASSPDGEGAFRAMSKALKMAGLRPEDIDYINAHGTGTVNNDESESKAMFRLFGSSVPPVSSTKSFTGHTTSASGGIETVICLLAMEYGFIPANLGWKQASEGCIIPEAEGRSKVFLKHVLCNSFAFGGNDSSLLISNARDYE